MKNGLIIREPDLYFDSLHHELNNFLRDTLLSTKFSNPLDVKKESVWRPAVEIKQTDKEYRINVQLPGVNKEDIDITLDSDFMTITAKSEEEKEEKEQEEHNEIKYHTCEFRYGKYQRTISFDTPIKAAESRAKYKNGILKITVPKQHVEQTETKHLEIE